jgi:hypothetical protein
MPRAIYAARPGPDDKLDQGPSRRPFQTVVAAAKRLRRPHHCGFLDRRARSVDQAHSINLATTGRPHKS